MGTSINSRLLRMTPALLIITNERMGLPSLLCKYKNQQIEVPLSGYGVQLNTTCRRSIMLSFENNRGFLYPLIDNRLQHYQFLGVDRFGEP